MGLSIHYSASLKDASVLSALVAEATDTAKSLKWEFNVVFDTDVSGIIISPTNCEPFVLCFTPEGKTCNLFSLPYGNPSDDYFDTIHVKTGHAGPEIHKALVDILMHLNKKYFATIAVCDEGEYWQTQDYQILLSHFTIDTLASHKLAHYFPRLSLPPELGSVTQTLSGILANGER